MFEVFTTREISIGIYIVIIIIIGWVKCRNELLKFFRCLMSIQLVIPFVMLVAYVSVIVYCSTRMFFWKWIYLKGILMWFIFVGVPFCFNAVQNVLPKHYFTREVTSNFKFVVLLEYITGTYTFSFPLEMFLQLLLAFLVIIGIFADSNSNKNVENSNKVIKKFCDILLCLIGFIILYFSIKELISSINTIVYQDVAFDLVSPIVLSVLFLPVAYLLAVFSKYQLIFVRMKCISITGFRRKMMIIRSCGISLKKLRYFMPKTALGFYVGMDDEDFNNTVVNINKEYQEYKSNVRKER